MSVSPRWRSNPKMTWHPRSIPASIPAGLKNDVNNLTVFISEEKPSNKVCTLKTVFNGILFVNYFQVSKGTALLRQWESKT